MGTNSWTCGDSPLTSFAADYREALVGLGYRPGPVEQRLAEMGWLSCWMADEGLAVDELTVGRVDEFVDTCAGLGRRIPSRRPLLEVLVVLLRRVGCAPEAAVAEPTPTEELLDRYAVYLTRERGLAPSTVDRYVRMAKVFLTERAARVGGTGAEGLEAADVFTYLLDSCGRLSVASAKREAGDLRSLLRFLYWDRIIEVDLGTAMPPVAGWRNTGIPQSVSPVEVRALLDGCDRSRSGGERDRDLDARCPSRASRARSPVWSWTISTGVPERSWCGARAVVSTGYRFPPMLGKHWSDISNRADRPATSDTCS